MDKKIVENISKISAFSGNLETIEKSLKEEKYFESYKEILAMIESIGIIIIEKVYKQKVEDSNIIVLSNLFNKYNEKEIREILISINGNLNSMDFENIQELDVLEALGNLDDIVKYAVEKHENIFEENIDNIM